MKKKNKEKKKKDKHFSERPTVNEVSYIRLFVLQSQVLVSDCMIFCLQVQFVMLLGLGGETSRQQYGSLPLGLVCNVSSLGGETSHLHYGSLPLGLVCHDIMLGGETSRLEYGFLLLGLV